MEVASHTGQMERFCCLEGPKRESRRSLDVPTGINIIFGLSETVIQSCMKSKPALLFPFAKIQCDDRG
jgi:hypothetical protein